MQLPSCSRCCISDMNTDILRSASTQRLLCRPKHRAFSHARVNPQMRPSSRRVPQQPAAVAAPDRAPDAEQAPQQQSEIAAAEQPDIPAVSEAAGAAEAAAAPAYDVPRLATLPLQAIVNTKVRGCEVGREARSCMVGGRALG